MNAMTLAITKHQQEGKIPLEYPYYPSIHQAISRYHLFNLKENILPIEQKIVCKTK